MMLTKMVDMIMLIIIIMIIVIVIIKIIRIKGMIITATHFLFTTAVLAALFAMSYFCRFWLEKRLIILSTELIKSLYFRSAVRTGQFIYSIHIKVSM